MPDAVSFEDAAPAAGISFEDAAPEAKRAPEFRMVEPGIMAPTFRTSEEAKEYREAALAPKIAIPRIKGRTLAGQIAAAPVNVASGFVESGTTLPGAALLGAGPVAGKVGSALMGAGFGAPMVAQGLQDVYKGTALGEPQQAIEGGLSTLAGGEMTAGGLAGLRPEHPLGEALDTTTFKPPAPTLPQPQVRTAGRAAAPAQFVTLPQALEFTAAGEPIRRPLEEVRVPPEAPEGEPTFAPSGLGRPAPVGPLFGQPEAVAPPEPAAGTVQPPPPPMAPEFSTGKAAQAVRTMGEAQQRQFDFSKAVAEKVTQEQAEPLHPDKPLTENQLRIIRESLVKAVTDNQIPGPAKGLIAGSGLEHWADAARERIKAEGRLNALGDPELFAAAVIKGAAHIERGITEFAKWSAAMVKEFGEAIKPRLRSLFDESKNFRAAQFTKPKEEPGPPVTTPVTEAVKPTAPTAPTKGQEVPALRKGDRLVSVVKPDGSRYVAAFGDKTYDFTQIGRGKVPSIATPGGMTGKEWSHGTLPPGDTIVEDGGRSAQSEVTPAGAGPGTPHVSEVPQDQATGLRNAVADLERTGLGLKDAPPTVQRNMAAAWVDAGNVERIRPGTGAALANRLRADPNIGLTDTESALLLRHKVELWNKLNDAAERTHQGTPEERKIAQAEHDGLLVQFDSLLDSVNRSGERWGREGRWRQAMSREDFTFTSRDELNRYHRALTGEDLPADKTEQADRVAKQVKTASDAADAAQDKVQAVIKKAPAADTPQGKVWAKAKELLNSGMEDFDDLRNKIATDLGMSVDEVTKLLAKNKSTKRLVDDLWNKQQQARRLKEQAKRFVAGINEAAYQRAIKSIPRLMFSLKVGLHGTVALGTHAPMVAFDPRFTSAYVRNFGKMYKMVFSPAYYEMQMQNLKRRPNYIPALRSGLVVDPFQYEEYHTTAVQNLVRDWLGPNNMELVDKLTSSGNRGYSVLKLLRMDMFDQMWSDQSTSTRIPEVAESLSTDINHSTGVTKGKAPPGTHLAFFAPRLEGSRVAWLAVDPAKAVNTFANWKNASLGERTFAMNQLKSKARIFGTFVSLLALNQGFLTASKSKQKINGIPKALGGAGINPMEGDFMKFKAAGFDVAYGSAMLNMAKLPVRLATAIMFEGKTSKLILEDERVYKIAGDYLRSQMSPIAGTATDLALGRDYAGRPLPRKGFGLLAGDTDIPKRLRLHGVTKPYTQSEYWGETLTPIPISEGIREVWGQGLGMSPKQIDHYLRAWAIISLMAGTGTRVTDDYKTNK